MTWYIFFPKYGQSERFAMVRSRCAHIKFSVETVWLNEGLIEFMINTTQLPNNMESLPYSTLLNGVIAQLSIRVVRRNDFIVIRRHLAMLHIIKRFVASPSHAIADLQH